MFTDLQYVYVYFTFVELIVLLLISQGLWNYNVHPGGFTHGGTRPSLKTTSRHFHSSRASSVNSQPMVSPELFSGMSDSRRERLKRRSGY